MGSVYYGRPKVLVGLVVVSSLRQHGTRCCILERQCHCQAGAAHLDCSSTSPESTTQESGNRNHGASQDSSATLRYDPHWLLGPKAYYIDCLDPCWDSAARSAQN